MKKVFFPSPEVQRILKARTIVARSNLFEFNCTHDFANLTEIVPFSLLN